MKRVLAIDMGATSIRAILGGVDKGKLVTEEVARFSHKIVDSDGRSRWEIKKIIENLTSVIKEYHEEISAIAVDTWGVDFGIIDKKGNLIAAPVSYRDEKHSIGLELSKEKLSLEEIFMSTGNQIMSINSLFQLLALREYEKNQYDQIDKLLFMPDLIGYFLTGQKVLERTIASTSQFYDIKNKKLSNKILEAFDIPKDFFCEEIASKDVIGSTRTSIIEELRNYDIPIICVASHDTASAALVTEAYKDCDTIFLSCGTWSLIGCFTPEVMLSTEIFENSLTNEIGFASKNMFFKNINGLYLVEKLKSQLEDTYSKTISFEEITEYVIKANGEKYIIDVENELFSGVNFDMIDAINSYLGLDSKLEDFYYFKIIYESLAKKYSETIEQISRISGKRFKKIHMIGGGCKSSLLCKLVQESTNIELVAGPLEATAYGNLVVQLMAIGEISSIDEGIEIVRNSSELKIYR